MLFSVHNWIHLPDDVEVCPQKDHLPSFLFESFPAVVPKGVVVKQPCHRLNERMLEASLYDRSKMLEDLASYSTRLLWSRLPHGLFESSLPEKYDPGK